MSKPQVTRIGCYAVISEYSRILLCRLGEGMVHRGRWTLPGGGQDFGETLKETVLREVFEETGLKVKVGPLISHSSGVWQLPEKDMHSFQFLFTATVISGDLTHEVDGSTDLVEWVEMDAITVDNAVNIVHRAKEFLMQPACLP
ncbi:MAG: NUDIX domain-containing protein [Armatimonadota bacterium]